MGICGSSIIIDFVRSNVNVIGLIKCDGESSFKRYSIQFSSKNKSNVFEGKKTKETLIKIK